MVIAIPSASTVQGVARTSREGDRDEPLREQPLDTLRNGACPYPARQPVDMHPATSVLPTSQTDRRTTTERNAHHQHDGGPTHWRPPILTGHSACVWDDGLWGDDSAGCPLIQGDGFVLRPVKVSDADAWLAG